MHFKAKLLFLLVFVFVLSCSKDDQSDNPPDTPSLDRIEIPSFRILDNSTNGLTVEAKILLETQSQIKISDHGVHLLKGDSPYDKISLGSLEEDSFITTFDLDDFVLSPTTACLDIAIVIRIASVWVRDIFGKQSSSLSVGDSINKHGLSCLDAVQDR